MLLEGYTVVTVTVVKDLSNLLTLSVAAEKNFDFSEISIDSSSDETNDVTEDYLADFITKDQLVIVYIEQENCIYELYLSIFLRGRLIHFFVEQNKIV